MNIAFYAPMKSPHHPHPSGDRRIARLLITALEHAGHKVELMSELRAWEGAGDPDRQAEIQRQGESIAEQLIEEISKRPVKQRPGCWFSYHLFHKAPDWIGPRVAVALNIPYLLAEASWAKKQQHGPWSQGLKQVGRALTQSAAIFCLNPRDLPALESFPGIKPRLHALSPFLDLTDIPRPDPVIRAELALVYELDKALPWIACVAMMREDAKLESYRLLAASLTRCKAPFQLIVIGDGTARAQVEALFKGQLVQQSRFIGQQSQSDTLKIMSACDLYAWPAIDEAIGMALLEAQACGLPVIAGASGAIPQIIKHGETGLLSPPGDVPALLDSLERLLSEVEQRENMSAAALEHIALHHSLDSAATRLDEVICQVVSQANPLQTPGEK